MESWGWCWIARMGKTQTLFLKAKKDSENTSVGQLVVNNALQTKNKQLANPTEHEENLLLLV